MPKFSKISESRLMTCKEPLIVIARTVIQVIDFSVACGYRNKEEQDAAYGKYSRVKFPNGKHNMYPSDAFDLLPFPLDWNDTDSFIFLAGHVLMTAKLLGYNIRWGHDWNRNNNLKDDKFVDMPHYELI